MSAELSWIVTIVGLIGFWLAGNKVWWAWYINIANQVLWVIFALVSGYYAFLLGTAFYLAVFVKNAYQWTRDHFHPAVDTGKTVGEVLQVENREDGLFITGRIDDKDFWDKYIVDRNASFSLGPRPVPIYDDMDPVEGVTDNRYQKD